MAQSSGSADLPLHGGRVPPWLAQRMSSLGRVIVEAIVLEYGRDELLARLANPFWFQSFGAVMGMDWHSSGITTSVMGALKRGLEPVSQELGLYVCGGRGKHSRKTPAELVAVGEHTGLPGDQLARTSRLVAKVDSSAVQDGFELYLHAFVVAGDGSWVVVQQGMSAERRTARRYHWHSGQLQAEHPDPSSRDFLQAPHSGIDGVLVPGHTRDIANLTDPAAEASRRAQLDLVGAGPDKIVDTALALRDTPQTLPLPHLQMPAHHPVLASDVRLRRLHASLAAAADRGPADYADLLLQPGIGARTVLTLSMVAEVIFGAPYLFQDPGRYSLALGGKDGHPFPVPLDVYDRTIGVLRSAVSRARLGNAEELAAMRRLDQQARRAEAWFAAHAGDYRGPTYDEFVASERRLSSAYGGRTVFDDRRDQNAPEHPTRPAKGRGKPKGQLDLF